MTRNLKRVPQFLRDYPAYNPGQIRWWIFNEHTNGMRQHSVVVRIGRAVWLDVDAFEKWVDSLQERAA